jgi:hypothetical protein
MVPGLTDALNPFQQDFSEAEDFVNILRQANSPFDSFDHALISELLPLQQFADSWIQLALQNFMPAMQGFGGSPAAPSGAQDANTPLAVAPSSSLADAAVVAPPVQILGGPFDASPLTSILGLTPGGNPGPINPVVPTVTWNGPWDAR